MTTYIVKYQAAEAVWTERDVDANSEEDAITKLATKIKADLSEATVRERLTLNSSINQS